MEFTFRPPENSENWLSLFSRNGILNISFVPRYYKDNPIENERNISKLLSDNIDNAINISTISEELSAQSEFSILDAAMADSSVVVEKIIERITKHNSEISAKNKKINHRKKKIRILLAHPESEFAKKRAARQPRNKNAKERLNLGLDNIIDHLNSIRLNEQITVPDSYSSIVEKIHYINNQENFRYVEIEVRLYRESMAGPLYFFNNILLQGKFNPQGSANIMPWITVVNDPNCDSDLYDVAEDEFNAIWEHGSEKTYNDNESFIRLVAIALVTKAYEKECADIYAHMMDILEEKHNEVFDSINNSQLYLAENTIRYLANSLNELNDEEFNRRLQMLREILN